MTRTHEFSRKIKEQRLAFATLDGIIHCEGCGIPLRRGQYEFDHDIDERFDGPSTFENCRVLCIAVCHKAKTAKGHAAQAKERAQRQKEKGIRTVKGKPLISAPFPKTEKSAKREKKLSLPPRSLYRE